MAISKSLKKQIQNIQNYAQLHCSKFDADIYYLIHDGFILIPAENFSKIYMDSIRERHELRSRLIKIFFFIDPITIQNSNNKIRISLTFVSFNEELDEFFLQVTLDKPTDLQLFVLEDTRESTLEYCALHSVVLTQRAAQEVMKEIEEGEFDH